MIPIRNWFACNSVDEIVSFGYSKKELEEILKNSNVFETSGCTDCNRPYYNERAGAKQLYNYPDKVEDSKFKNMLEIIYSWFI